jgi:8-oxo-dGTP diphosphatase
MKLKNTEVIVIKGDITEVDVQAIVNPANNLFAMGGGLAGVIKKKGGKIIEDEAFGQGPAEAADAVLTSAGALRVKYVIHAVTMKMDFKTDAEIIRKATFNTLLCAQKNNISSIALPALGCGTGRFSFEAASKIMAQEVFRYVRQTKEPCLEKIIFVLNCDDAFMIFNKNVVGYLDYMNKKISEGPFLTVDGIIEYEGGIVMIERSNPPFGWALPGGFVDYGESIEDAVVREVREETGLTFVNFKQFKVYSAATRDPRFHTVSVVFCGQGQGKLCAASDAKDAGVFKVGSLPEAIAFDHKKVIQDYIKSKSKP